MTVGLRSCPDVTSLLDVPQQIPYNGLHAEGTLECIA